MRENQIKNKKKMATKVGDVSKKFEKLMRSEEHYTGRKAVETENQGGGIYGGLRLKCRHYSAIHTNCMLCHCTTSQYNTLIIFDIVVRQKVNFEHEK